LAEDNARKVSFTASDLTNVIGNATTVYAARGKRVVTIDLEKEELTSKFVRKSLLGPTGNLRAPAILSGNRFVVGFNEELYERLLCK
jgi:arsenate reductase-like glutaredoxin family protein